MANPFPPSPMCLRCSVFCATFPGLQARRIPFSPAQRGEGPFAECLREAKFHAVETEPTLQSLSGEAFKFKSANKDDDARSDVKCLGFWRKMRQAYFDITPLARSRSQPSIYQDAEKSKMREYKARIIQVEHGDFTLALEKLTEQIAARRELPDSVVAGWLRCRFSFALLRTSLICLRGTRTKKMVKKANVELETLFIDPLPFFADFWLHSLSFSPLSFL